MKSYTLNLNPPSEYGPLMNMHEGTVKVILNECDRMSKQAALDEKQEMHIRLLAEEMISMLPHLMEYGSGKFWINNDDGVFEMHLSVAPKLTASNKTSPIAKVMNSDISMKSMVRRICGIIDKAASRGSELPDEDANRTSWSLGNYIARLKQQDPDKSKSDEWDELEHSILANIADDVIVKNVGNTIELILIKIIPAKA